MNPNSTRIFTSTNTSALGFSPVEIKIGCENENNVIITMAEPYMRPYSTRYMCDILCQSLSVSYQNPGYQKLSCYIENCNQNSIVYLFSKPFVGSWGCFFPFGSAGEIGSYSTSWFWTTALLLSAICLAGFVLNVSVIVMSLRRMTATCDMRKIIVAVCVYEALASVVFYLEHFLYWLNQGGPDTFMSNYVQKYVIDPIFVRTFGSYLLLVVSCHIAIFRPEALDHMLQSKLKTISFCLLFAVHIFFLYFMLVYPLAQYIGNAVADSVLLSGIVSIVMGSSIIYGVIFWFSILFGLIMNLIAHHELYRKKRLTTDASVLEKLKENQSVAFCVSAMMAVELIVLIPQYCNLWYMIKPLLQKPAAATSIPTLPSSGTMGGNTTLPPAVLAQLAQQHPMPPTTTVAPSPVDLWVQNNFIPLGFFFEAALPILIALILVFIYRPSRQLVTNSKRINTKIAPSPLNKVVT